MSLMEGFGVVFGGGVGTNRCGGSVTTGGTVGTSCWIAPVCSLGGCISGNGSLLNKGSGVVVVTILGLGGRFKRRLLICGNCIIPFE